MKLKDIKEDLANLTASKAEIAHQVVPGERVVGRDGKVVRRDGKVVPNEEVAVAKAEAIAKLDSVVVNLVARA